MADENTAPETETETSAPAADVTPTAIPDATGDAGQQSLDLPAEGDTAPKPEAATGEPSMGGEQDSAATEADEAPTSEVPAAPEAPGTSESPTPVAEDSVDHDVASLDPAGADEAAPAPTSTPDVSAPGAQPALDGASDPTASSADAPAEAGPAPDQDISTSTGIGGDKAADVAPAEEPKLDPAPAPSPAPSSPGLFDHGKPLNLPEMSVPSDQGYPVAQPDASPVHPQTMAPLQNDGVLEDAGKVAEDAATGSISSSDNSAPEGKDGGEQAEDDNAEPVITDVEGYEPEQGDEGGEPSAVPPHVEHKLTKLFHKMQAMEAKIEKLLKELLG